MINEKQRECDGSWKVDAGGYTPAWEGGKKVDETKQKTQAETGLNIVL
jgi:hypothetical protein